MPHAALKTCAHPGCSALVGRGRCPVHRRALQRQVDANRGSARERGYTRSWDKARLVYLGEHPLCAECQRQGRVTAGTIVDHIIPHRGDQQLFWDRANWQTLCGACHGRKTLEEMCG